MRNISSRVAPVLHERTCNRNCARFGNENPLALALTNAYRPSGARVATVTAGRSARTVTWAACRRDKYRSLAAVDLSELKQRKMPMEFVAVA